MLHFNVISHWLGAYTKWSLHWTMLWWCFNTLRPRQNRCHFVHNILKCIFLNENIWISIKISLNFVSEGPISNIPTLVQIMAWRWPGDKLLSEPMLCRFTNILASLCLNDAWEMWLWFRMCKFQTQPGDWYLEYSSNHNTVKPVYNDHLMG